MRRHSPTKIRLVTQTRMQDRYVCASGCRTVFPLAESIRFRSRSIMHPPSEPGPLQVRGARVWEPAVPLLVGVAAHLAAGRRPWHKMRLTWRQNADSQALIRLTSSLRIICGNFLLDTTSAGSPEIVRCVRSWATGSGAETGQ